MSTSITLPGTPPAPRAEIEWIVDNNGGDDSGTGGEDTPLLSLDQAITNSSTGDSIRCRPSSTPYIITGALGKSIRILGSVLDKHNQFSAYGVQITSDGTQTDVTASGASFHNVELLKRIKISPTISRASFYDCKLSNVAGNGLNITSPTWEGEFVRTTFVGVIQDGEFDAVSMTGRFVDCIFKADAFTLAAVSFSSAFTATRCIFEVGFYTGSQLAAVNNGTYDDCKFIGPAFDGLDVAVNPKIHDCEFQGNVANTKGFGATSMIDDTRFNIEASIDGTMHFYGKITDCEFNTDFDINTPVQVAATTDISGCKFVNTGIVTKILTGGGVVTANWHRTSFNQTLANAIDASLTNGVGTPNNVYDVSII